MAQTVSKHPQSLLLIVSIVDDAHDRLFRAEQDSHS